MRDKAAVSACVVCQDNAATIERCLKSLSFCDEIVVVDGFSTDGTYEIAQRHATILEQREFDNLMAQRNHGYSLANGGWLLWIDSDEEVTTELAEEIRTTLEEGEDLPDGFRISRRWYYPTSWGSNGTFSRRYVHLFRKSSAKFGPAYSVHITPQPFDPESWRIASLKGVIEHWPWQEMDDILCKVRGYARRDAEALAERGRSSGPLRAIMHGLGRFLRYYVREKGFLRGAPGFFVSWALAHEAFLKYARLWEINQQRKHGDAEGVIKSPNSRAE